LFDHVLHIIDSNGTNVGRVRLSTEGTMMASKDKGNDAGDGLNVRRRDDDHSLCAQVLCQLSPKMPSIFQVFNDFRTGDQVELSKVRWKIAVTIMNKKLELFLSFHRKRRKITTN